MVGLGAPVLKGVDSESCGPGSVNDHIDPEGRERLRCETVVAQMLQDLQDRKIPHDQSEETPTDQALNQLNYKNFPALR